MTASDELIWLPERGVGYYPVKAGVAPYDDGYFARYARMANTFVGRHLMHLRTDFTEKYIEREALTDIGIGSGAFITTRLDRNLPTTGYDVNPVAAAMLRRYHVWRNVYAAPVDYVSLWDVLEHIPDFAPLLNNVRRGLFVSLPLFDNAEHVLRSKHFRKDEHCWYFTRAGLVRVMHHYGFACKAFNRDEEQLGREDIGSFYFERRDADNED